MIRRLATAVALAAPAMLAAQTTAPIVASRPAEEAAARVPLEAYLAGHATGDPAQMRRAFHPDAKLFWVRDGTVAQRTSADYIAGFTGRPAGDEARRRRWIESVTVTGDAAVATVVLDYPAVRFTDYMSLLRTPDGWRIVNKLFQAQPKTPG